ncbi:PTS sugar transporter subunit IIA [Thiohalorhabdus methylotrophus]|uniref:PTS sugar transporter subunit IIA n=1 Tax=Thiohalorhabdus methylotrophus TaxID=3242694 RepID=A0ABV4TT46_9GAMM
MAGILIIAHQYLAHEMIRAAQHIMGREEPALAGVDIGPESPYEEARERILAALDEVRTEDGTIILTDMYGGTPANLGMDFLDPGRVEVIAGVNLPMLVRLLTYRSRPLEEQVQKALEGGWEGIVLGRSRSLQYSPPGRP